MTIVKLPNSDEAISIRDLFRELGKIKGGYNYMGACSNQMCFPLKNGGELRFSIVDDDCLEDGEESFGIDLYDGSLPPCISGPSNPTG